MSDKINKANSIVGVIRRSFKFLTPEIFSKLFKALVRPHLEYANVVWSPHFKQDIIALENVQRRATKLVPGLKEMSYTERLKLLNLPSLTYRRLRGDMIETFKILRGYYDSKVSDGILCLHTDRNSRNNRGHSLKLYKKRCKTKLKQNIFSHRIVNMWNDLPQKVIDAPSIVSFENRLDKHWQQQDIKYNFKSTWTKIKSANRTRTDKTQDLDLSI